MFFFESIAFYFQKRTFFTIVYTKDVASQSSNILRSAKQPSFCAEQTLLCCPSLALPPVGRQGKARLGKARQG